MTNNDKKILDLKRQIQEKKNSLQATERFSPVTNCSLELDGVRHNLNVLNKDQLIVLLVKLNSYQMSAKELGVLTEYNLSGFNITDWIKDVKAKLMNVNRKVEEERLRTLEQRLHQLLSGEKKVELEIEEIEASL